nr:hypothetical protein [Candidatus Sigynarchaeum springense]
MKNVSIVGAVMLMVGGSAFVILAVSMRIIFVPIDIALNVLICLANGAAIKVYKDKGAKSAAIASLFLLLTEAAWIALPIIVLVPVALLVLAIHRVKGTYDAPVKIAGSILAFVGMALTIPFIPFVMSLVFAEGFGFSGEALETGSIFITWPLFFIGRDIVPGILLLLGEGTGGSTASEPTYKAYIKATSTA